MKNRKLLALLLGAAVLLTLFQAGRLVLRKRSSESPPSSPAAKVVITIEPGENLARVARELKEKSVISNEKFFVFVAEIKGADKKVQAGEYEFDLNMRMKDAMDILILGKQRYYRLLVPEGYNIYDIAAEVNKIWPGQGQNFLDRCKDKRFMREFGIDADSLEGYLYPDTYFVRRFDTVDILIREMVAHFKREWKPEYEQRAIDLGYTRHQIITIASIAEKEAGLIQEKSLVAAVIYNRLKLKMPLCMDPTVIYGLLPGFNNNLKRSDLATYTPYNTYKIHGLPPGPICNPGKYAIRAALWPAQANYLYFVSKNDGSHFFSSRYADHLDAVKLYQHGGFEEEQGTTAQGGASVETGSSAGKKGR